MSQSTTTAPAVITIATGETFEVSLGQHAYLDMGDGMDGGEVSGAIEAVTAATITIDGYRVRTARIIDFQLD